MTDAVRSGVYNSGNQLEFRITPGHLVDGSPWKFFLWS